MITTPAGCIRTCTGSFLSKKILFVAIARTLGVAARLNPHDRSMEYMENGRFVPVLARTEKNCTLILKAGETVQWKYFQNWSIAKLENGRYTSVSYTHLLAAAEELPKAQSKFKEFVKKFMKRKTAVISLAFIVFIILMAIIGPYVVPYDPQAPDYTAMMQGRCV